MKWEAVEDSALGGIPVRRASWPVTRSLGFTPGGGTERTVGVLRNGATESILTATNITPADWQADDWVLVAVS